MRADEYPVHLTHGSTFTVDGCKDPEGFLRVFTIDEITTREAALAGSPQWRLQTMILGWSEL